MMCERDEDQMIKLGAIGCGNMATAIIRGAAKGMKGKIAFAGYDIDPKKAEALSDVGLEAKASAAELVEWSDYVLFSVKPQNCPEMFASLSGASHKDKVFISIAAGITAEAIKEALGFDAKVVLVMPNTPLLVGMGATAMAPVEPTEREEFENVKEIFGCAGLVCEIPADKLCEVIALNGSSPAFLYEYAKGFIRYGEENGIPYETGLKLFCQSMRGAADMMEHSGKDVEELIQMVSSKGGTTIAGLEGLSEMGLQKAVTRCCENCTKRAYELSK